MRVAVASGKGGTGKTTVSAALVSIWKNPVFAVDLDVEAPNLHLFLKPEITGTETAFMEVPVADESRCTYCRKCAEICQFKAISVLGEILLTFPDMCHGCGACLAVCPENALSPGKRELGEILWGRAGASEFLMGRLRIGEAMSPPLMRAVKKKLQKMTRNMPSDVIIDSPPGVSCPAVNAVMDSDVIILVTEPTPFGLYDLKLACNAFAPLNKPTGVVVNRQGIGNNEVKTFCIGNGLEILAEIPYDRRIAEVYSEGGILTEAIPQLRGLFQELADKILGMTSVPSALVEA